MMFPTFDIPLRPLLYAAGIAAASAGVYFLLKKRRYRVLQTGSGVGAVCALDPGLMCDTDEGRDAQRCSAEPEVLEQMETLLGSVQQLTKEVLEIRSICEQIDSERQREQEAYRILRAEYDQMRKALKIRDKLYKTKYREALDTKVQLENKIFNLVSEMNKVNDFLRQLEKELSESNRTYKKEQQDQDAIQDIHKYLVSDCNLMESGPTQKIDFPMASKEKSEMYAKSLSEHLALMEKYSELLKEYEHERESHEALKLQYEQTMKECSDKQNPLTMFQGTQDMENKRFLEKVNSELRIHKFKLEEMVRELDRFHHDLEVTCGVIKEDIDRAQGSFNTLQSRCDETMKQRDELLQEIEKERFAHITLKKEDSEMTEVEKEGNNNQDVRFCPKRFLTAVVCVCVVCVYVWCVCMWVCVCRW
ncbi:spindle pole body component 110-like isoform X1 [Silurus meridionalis]|uniref:spindle pole body component 110-like isoform X1 n=1 Tax=Silurus meridionalis TaxID=175797 RepID=UPI001EEB3672|nr:spindle pole body component 110-like isoform X1 [Silurus meridionalis]